MKSSVDFSVSYWFISIPFSTLTVFPCKSLTRQCRYTFAPNCVLTLTVVNGSAKNGNGSWVVVSVISSSSSSGVSVNGEENSCQKFFGNVSKGSPALGRFTEIVLKSYFYAKLNKYASKTVRDVELFVIFICLARLIL